MIFLFVDPGCNLIPIIGGYWVIGWACWLWTRWNTMDPPGLPVESAGLDLWWLWIFEGWTRCMDPPWWTFKVMTKYKVGCLV